MILEIGPGTADGKSIHFPGSVTVDPYSENAEHRVIWGSSPLPFEDNSFKLVFASHVLEHIPWYRTDAAIAEVYRVLAVGGEFEVYVPDFSYIVSCYQNKKCGDKWRVFNPEGDWMTWVNGRLFTYGEDSKELISKERPLLGTHHKAVFDDEYLANKLRKAGFSSVRTLTKRRNGKAHSVVEAGAIAVK